MTTAISLIPNLIFALFIAGTIWLIIEGLAPRRRR